LVNGKNLQSWLKIALSLKEVLPYLKFLIVGRGPIKKNLENFIFANKMENYVQINDYIANIEEIYKKSSLFLFLSEYESFGNVVVESILCGTPVLASNIPAMREIFGMYEEFLVNLDSKSLDLEILNRIKQYNKLKSLTELIRYEFIDRFSLEKHLDELIKVYEDFN
jgi:glycosyltransferase involved in cell wall biosynthesis